MQLSLLTELPELEKKVFLDIFAKVYFDTRRNRPRLKTIEGQQIPAEMCVGVKGKMIEKYPEGTVYKLDARLVQRRGRSPYFLALKQQNVQRALEFFDHNVNVERGTCEKPKVKKVLKIKVRQ